MKSPWKFPLKRDHLLVLAAGALALEGCTLVRNPSSPSTRIQLELPDFTRHDRSQSRGRNSAKRSATGFRRRSVTLVASISLTTAALSDGAYSFYAAITDAAGNSTCARTAASYILDTVAPSAPTAISRTAPAVSPSTSNSVTLSIGGLVSGDQVKLNGNAICSESDLSSRVAAGKAETIVLNGLSDGAYVFLSTSTGAAGNVSSCSSATASYTMDTTAPVVDSLTLKDALTGNTLSLATGTPWN